jgi:hypothetical protein
MGTGNGAEDKHVEIRRPFFLSLAVGGGGIILSNRVNKILNTVYKCP